MRHIRERHGGCLGLRVCRANPRTWCREERESMAAVVTMGVGGTGVATAGVRGVCPTARRPAPKTESFEEMWTTSPIIRIYLVMTSVSSLVLGPLKTQSSRGEMHAINLGRLEAHCSRCATHSTAVLQSGPKLLEPPRFSAIAGSIWWTLDFSQTYRYKTYP